MRAELPRRGLAPRPPQGYVDAVQQLTPDDRRAPDQLREDELRQACRCRLTDTQGAERPCRMPRSGLRFFYARTRPRPWPVFARGRPRHPPPLPVVVSRQAVRALLAGVEPPTAQRGLPRLYACGRRLPAGPPRPVADREAHRMLGRGPQGQGGPDRLGPLAPRGLALGRACGQRQRPRPGLFPAREGAAPLAAPALPKPCQAVGRQRRLATEASLPPLRHSEALHLVARGGARRVLQARRGHRRPRTTARDTPLPPPTRAIGHATITARLADRCTRGRPPLPPGADLVRRAGGEDLERCGHDRRPRHRPATEALLRCRTEAFGGPRWPCQQWGPEPDVDHSGRHRRGPTGQRLDPAAWLAARRQARRPRPYGHGVFTRPPARRGLVCRHQHTRDDSFRRAAAPALIPLAADPHDGGGRSGVLGGLHTWTRPLTYPPPGHGLGPAGGVAADRTAGRPARPASLVPVQALATRLRGRLQAVGPQAGPRGGASTATRPCKAQSWS
jgi:hypothetical protein